MYLNVHRIHVAYMYLPCAGQKYITLCHYIPGNHVCIMPWYVLAYSVSHQPAILLSEIAYNIILWNP